MTRLSVLFLVSCMVSATIAFTTVSNTQQQQTRRTNSKLYGKDPKKEIGVQAPIGFFDPLNLLERGPYGDKAANFRHYRGVEVKHGRIAMAATLGMLVQENYHFTGYLSPSKELLFSDVPNGLAALNVVPLIGWVQMAVVIGLHEVLVKQRPGKAPGDFGTGYFGVALDDQSDYQLRTLSVEIANGRLAMLGILGMFASESIHGYALYETRIFG